MRFLLLFLCLIQGSLAAVPSPNKIKVLYSSLDPSSLSQHLAFYQLYPNSKEGQLALKHAWKLISGSTSSQSIQLPPTLAGALDGLISLVNKPAGSSQCLLSDAELKAIEQLAARLPNRKLKGSKALTEEEVQKLDPQEIDLARGLLLSQLGPKEQTGSIRSYEALLDMMALQILAHTPLDAPPETKIRALNRFIFEEMGFRFPPHSLYAKDIDLYTFLPSVLDSHRGVCLGVSILYICLAQRLSLPLELVTPPGHIYVRYRAKDQEINIETTARGIHIDSEDYLAIDTRSLQQRSIKEVIGLAHYNQASLYWQKRQFDKAIAAYEKALPYMPEDKLLQELLAYNYIFNGDIQKGEAMLRTVVDHLSEDAVSKRTLAEDYLKGHVDTNGILAVFQEVDDTRASILQKRDRLQKILEVSPHFRAGLLHLTITWLQLHRNGEALETLERLHAIDQCDPTVEYYLAALYLERYDYQHAWSHLKNAEKLCQERHHSPKALKELKREIVSVCPE